MTINQNDLKALCERGATMTEARKALSVTSNSLMQALYRLSLRENKIYKPATGKGGRRPGEKATMAFVRRHPRTAYTSALLSDILGANPGDRFAIEPTGEKNTFRITKEN